MSKPQRRVFNPDRIDTDIGGHSYIIEPQPMVRILEFDDVMNQLASQFDDLTDTFYVTDDETGDDVAGPFQSDDEAQAYIQAESLEGKSVRVQGVPVRDVLERLISSPYVILKPLIPDLEAEHIENVSFPELKFIFGLLIEVNGLEWFEALVKNVLEPLLPRLTDVTAGALYGGLQRVLTVSTATPAEPSGETPLTTS